MLEKILLVEDNDHSTEETTDPFYPDCAITIFNIISGLLVCPCRYVLFQFFLGVVIKASGKAP